MRILVQNLKLVPSRDLHLIWERVHEGEQTRVVARWINRVREDCQTHENHIANNDDEARGPWLGISLQFA